jgi:HD superfamily phosphohydrolase
VKEDMLPGMEAEQTGSQPWSRPKAIQEFFIPVWSQVRLTTSEVRLVDHPAFKRLADIYQLGQTHLVFRGATHRRWEHALGTLHAANLMCSALLQNFEEATEKSIQVISGQWRRGDPLNDQEIAFIRLSALLHDIGHIAAGHTFEDELGLLDQHDADGRLNYILDRDTWRGVKEPSLRALLDEEYEVAAAATGLELSASEIFLEIVSKTRVDNKHVSDTFRMSVCRDIVGNTICGDLIDYLHRDWHHLGKPRAFDDRLLDYFEIREHLTDHSDARLVVNLRHGAEIRHDAVTAIFELLESRYQLGEVALFHRTKLTASAMLERLVAELADAAGDKNWFEGQLDHLLECTDEEMVELLVTRGLELSESLSGESRKRLDEAIQLGRSLRYRVLHRKLIAYKSSDMSAALRQTVSETLGGSDSADNRLSTCRALERDFALPAGSVVLYCPAKAPHAKIAKVQVLVQDQIDTLSGFDGKTGDLAGTGGLLSAQSKRFEGLWRVQVSVSSVALQKLEETHTRSAFERTVRDLVLRMSGGERDQIEETARDIASSLIQNPDFNTGAKKLVEVGQAHGRSASYTTYVSGASTLSSLMVEP